MKNVTLNNGVAMPMIGFGVYQIEPSEAQRAVEDALEVGYRLIDTAAAYSNEEGVGAAIAKCGVKREELFVTTKLWVQDYGYENALKAFDVSMKKLGLDYLDLYLMHKPYGDYYGAWRALEKLYNEGRIRAIGVTSFWNERLADLMNCNEVAPAVNQIETNVWRQQRAAAEFMAKHGVCHQAWAPFAEGKNDVFNEPTLQALAGKYGKTTAQIMLRWLIQRGISVIPKTTHKERMIQNLDVFDFELTEEEVNTTVAALDLGKSLIYDEMDPEIAFFIGSLKIHD